MLFERERWIAALFATALGACAAHVAGDEAIGDEALEPEVEPVAEALTNVGAQAAVWLDDPERPLDEEYPSDAGYRIGVQHVKRVDVGLYAVVLSSHGLPSLAFATAYGTDATRCKVQTLTVTGLGLFGVVGVKCHSANGQPQNSRFVVSAWTSDQFTGRAAGGHVDASGAVLSSFNALQGTVNVSKPSPGQYRIRLGNLGAAQRGGTVQVGANGDNTRHCKVVRWGSDGNDRTIDVACFATNSDAATDTEFTFMYDEEIIAQHGRGAYAWANDATSASYSPHTFFTFMRGPSETASSTSATGSLMANETGRYKMTYHGLSEDVSWKAYLFVGAYGSGSEYCKIRNWSRAGNCQTNCDIEAQTLCFDKAGSRKNTRYVQTWGSFQPFDSN